ncbi:MAG: tetratricopeptide repeat protein [Caulobacterales bacterium]
MNRNQRRLAKRQAGPATPAPSPALRSLFEEAARHHQAGRLGEAEQGYRRVLALTPHDAVAHNNLGNVLKAQGQFDAAVASYARAVALKPDIAELHNNLANALLAQGKPESAAASYRQALALKPGYAEAHYNLANVLMSLGRPKQAEEGYARALALRPAFYEAHVQLGMMQMADGRVAGAAASFQRALALSPDDVGCNIKLGDALLGQGELEPARAAYEHALALKPESFEANNGLGIVLRDLGDLGGAVARFERAAALRPDLATGHYNLANVLHGQGKVAQSLECYERAVSLWSDRFEAEFEHARELSALGNREEAAVQADRALAARREFAAAHSNFLLSLTYSERPAREIFAAHRRFGEIHERTLTDAPSVQLNDRDPRRRLRIGYVSPDFRSHATAWFLTPLLTAHNRAAVEVFCYAEVAKPDRRTEHFKGLADHWRSTVGVSDEALAGRIREDQIDILVDVAGHTAGNRLTMFALRPSPVQVTWLGNPNTTGLAAMDYKLVDAVTDPPAETEIWSTETLVRLDHAFLCYQSLVDDPEPAPPPCLAAGSVTFGSYNNPVILSEGTLDAWARLLSRVADSRLVLKGRAFDDEGARAWFHERLARRGVARDRVRLMGFTTNAAEHRTHYAYIDVALDPFPYNGTTTTCDALWMGVPVVTFRGDRHATRVGASILTQLGLQDLIATDVEGYVDIAASLAADRERLAELRATLRPRMAASPLTDAPAFARKLESAYRRMWTRWCDEAQP